MIFDVTPGFDLTYGKDAQVSGSVTAGVAFSNYSDNSNLNTTLFSSSFISRFDDGKMKLGFNIGFNELNQNSPDIRGLTRRDEVAPESWTGRIVNPKSEQRSPCQRSDVYTVPI